VTTFDQGGGWGAGRQLPGTPPDSAPEPARAVDSYARLRACTLLLVDDEEFPILELRELTIAPAAAPRAD